MAVAGELIRMTGFKNIKQVGAAFSKSSGQHGSQDATASSVDLIEDANSLRRGVSFSLPASSGNSWTPNFMVGLMHVPNWGQQQQEAAARADVRWQSVTYAAAVYGPNSCIEVWESGAAIKTPQSSTAFGTWSPGNTIEVGLSVDTPPRVEYRLKGAVIYTSQKTPVEFPLLVKVWAYNQGPLMEDLRWLTPHPLHMRVHELETALHKAIADQAQLAQDGRAALRADVEQLQARLEDELQGERAARHADNELQQAQVEARLRTVIEENEQLRQHQARLEVELRGERDARRADNEQQQAQMENRLQAVIEENEQLRQRQAHLEEEREEREGERAARRAESEQQQARLSTVIEENLQLRQRQAWLEEEREGERAEQRAYNEQQQARVRTVTDENEQLRQRQARLEEELRGESAARWADSEQQKARLEEEREGERVAQRAQNEQQQAQLHTVIEENEQLRQRQAQLEKELQSERAARCANNEQQQARLEELQGERAVRRTDIEQLQARMDARLDAVIGESEQLRQFQARERQLQAEIDNLRAVSEQTSVAVRALAQAQRAELQMREMQLQSNGPAAHAALGGEHRQVVRWEAEMQTLREENEWLRRRQVETEDPRQRALRLLPPAAETQASDASSQIPWEFIGTSVASSAASDAA